MNKAGEFLGQVKAELQKVTWPTRKETYGTTVVVIVLVLMVAWSPFSSGGLIPPCRR